MGYAEGSLIFGESEHQQYDSYSDLPGTADRRYDFAVYSLEGTTANGDGRVKNSPVSKFTNSRVWLVP